MKTIIETLKRKWAEYLLEIVVIIFGILGAFALSNWGEDRQRRTEEIAILKSVKAGLQSDILDIEENIGIHRLGFNSSSAILQHMDSNQPYHDSLAILFNNCILYSVFVHTTSAFQTLKAYGVNIISNEELRNKIISLYDGRYNYLNLAQNNFSQRIEESLNDFLSSRFYDSYGLEQEGFNGKMIPLNYEGLKRDDEFLYYLRSTRNRNQFYLNYVLEPVRQDVIAVIENINEELSFLE